MPDSQDDESLLYQAFVENPDPGMIAPAQDGARGVALKFDSDWRTCRIWEGYFRASQILLGECLREPIGACGLIFPALFNLRHALEVALKWHIKYAGGSVPIRAGHNLDKLLQAFRQTAHDLDDEASYVSEYALNCISELALVDPHSVAFRYSNETDGSPIAIEPECWDLRRLYFTVDSLSLWFDGLSGQIDLSRDDDYQAYRRS